MKLKLLLLSLLSCVNLIAVANQGVLRQLISNINEISSQPQATSAEMNQEFLELSNHGKYNDLMILELYIWATIPDATAQSFLEGQNGDGSWDEVDYTDTKRSRWSPAEHITRLYALAKVYCSEQSRLCESEELLDAILKGVDYWHRSGLICPNWFYNDIRIPKHIGPVYLLLKDKLSAEQLAEAKRIMSRSTFTKTGQNRVWLAGNVLIKALLEDDFETVAEARDIISSEIFRTLDEGVQFDNSYHQHGAQMQFGNYGLAYISSMAYWARVFKDTPLAFSQSQISILREFLTEGLHTTLWRGYFDPSACARQVFENSQRGKAYSQLVSTQNMIEVDRPNADLYNSFIKFNFTQKRSKNKLVGSSYFWHSDYYVQRTDDWFASVRLNSCRTLPFEMTNSENLQGQYSADGVLVVKVDGNEYDNIYPLWDWRRLPGLTYFDDGEPLICTEPKTPTNRSSFVGGVASDGQGVAAMHLERDDVEARKGYFFIDDVIVALGADISVSNDHPLFTTLEQRLMEKDDVVSYGSASGEASTLQASHDRKEVEWLHCDKVGYCLLEPQSLELSREERMQSWRKIAVFFDEQQTAKGEIFTASIAHGRSSQNTHYEYVILPNRTAKQTQAFCSSPTIRVVENSKSRQVVASDNGATIGAIFYESGEVKITDDLSIYVSQPSVIMLCREGKKWVVSAADPTQELESVRVKITQRGKLQEHTIALARQSGFEGSTTQITI
ncbi:MAG: polysaccharide lyase family 8 super-sandwich domain-containing protein [Rikenellaceae bacterium]